MLRATKRAVLWMALGLSVLVTGCGRYRDKPSCETFFASEGTAGYALRDRGLVVDPESGLTWYRCNAGERFQNGACAGQPVLLSKADALAYVDDFSRASGRQWRLPSQSEMQTLMTDRCENPALNTQVFPSVISDSYWNRDESRHGDYMGCTTNTFNGYSFCRELATNQRPLMLILAP